MTTGCPNCGGSNFRRVMAYRNQSSLLAGCDIVQCECCDISFIKPAPDEAAWVRYNENYFERAHDGLNLAPEAVAFHQALAKIRVEHVSSHLCSSKASPSVLEIGPGVGYFANEWKKKFPETVYFAIESDTSLYSGLRKNGVRVLENGIQQLPERCVDVCIMSHVLEHVIYPSNVLHDSTKPLRNGGLLFVEVPCLDFMYKKIHEPHMLFFSRKALANCAKRAGFKEIQLTYHGDKISKIRRYSLVRRILVKLSRMMNLTLTIGFGPSDDIIARYNLTGQQALAVAQTRPFAMQEKPSRWLRMIARK